MTCGRGGKGSDAGELCPQARASLAPVLMASYCPVTCRFQRNPDVARNGRSGGWERIQLIAIDYHTVAGTAGAECKGDQRSKRARRSESRTDSNGLMETQE